MRLAAASVAVAVLAFVALAAPPAAAHRLSPAYFGFTETAPDVFAVRFKVSISGGLAAVLEPGIPEGCTLSAPVRTYSENDARLQIGEVTCPGGLTGREIGIGGLEATQTDVLVRVAALDGTIASLRLTPDAPRATVPARAGTGSVARTYFTLGVEHILAGVDHLLFVLALLLLVRGVGRLVATITAFTVAHSVTLAAATFGAVRAPAAAVEAVIALSILFLAVELARREGRGSRDLAPDLTTRWPWSVAFAFGLLHGFGFAGALAEAGLPDAAVPLALLFFNLGVEAGQLLFVAAAFAVAALLARAALAPPRRWRLLAAYSIGCAAAFWLIERTTTALA